MTEHSDQDVLKRVGARLVDYGLLTSNNDLNSDRIEQLYKDRSITEDRLASLIAEEWGVEQVFPSQDCYDLSLLNSFPRVMLDECQVLPLIETDDELVVAFATIPTRSTLLQLQTHSSKPLRPVIAAPSKIRKILALIPRDRISKPSGITFQKLIVNSDFLQGLVKRCAQEGSGELYLESIDDELVVRQRSNNSSVEVARLPIGKLHDLYQRLVGMIGQEADPKELTHVGGVCTRFDGCQIHLEFRIVKDSLGPFIHISVNKSVCSCCRQEVVFPADLRSKFEAYRSLRRGLILCSQRDPELAQRLALSLALDVFSDSGEIGIVGSCRFQHRSKLREMTTLRRAVSRNLDVWVAGPLHHREDFDLILREAGQRLIIVVCQDCSPLSALLAWLEIGARPSLLAHVLRCVVHLNGEEVDIFEPGPELRRLIAADCRQDLVEKLWPEKWEEHC